MIGSEIVLLSTYILLCSYRNVQAKKKKFGVVFSVILQPQGKGQQVQLEANFVNTTFT